MFYVNQLSSFLSNSLRFYQIVFVLIHSIHASCIHVPMFPERGKTAKVKKSMAFFHHLVGSDDDAAALLPLALATARYRVVVKRPRHAPPLADMEPGLCFEGKSTRFDVYPLKKMPS